MGRRKKGERVLGPYKHGDGWRVLECPDPGGGEGDRGDGEPIRHYFDSKAKANRYAEGLRAKLVAAGHTTETALELYLEHLRLAGNKPASIYRTGWSVRRFFPAAIPFWALREDVCKECYKALLREQPGHVGPDGKPGKPLKALKPDSHRNALAEVKTFLNWCVGEKLLGVNPAANVQGIGKRTKRKPQLVTKEARAWYHKALELAEAGDHGAVAALLALELGPRASEITTRLVRHVDEDEAPADRLWIPDSKTPAGERTVEVPEELRPFLVALTEGRPASGYLFPARQAKAAKTRGEPERPHWRDWPRENIQRICELAAVPLVTAHGMRGLLATLAYRDGIPAELIAATLGHREGRTSRDSYAQRGAPDEGARKRGRLRLVK